MSEEVVERRIHLILPSDGNLQKIGIHNEDGTRIGYVTDFELTFEAHVKEPGFRGTITRIDKTQMHNKEYVPIIEKVLVTKVEVSK